MEETKTNSANNAEETKFCKECGQKIPKKAVICTHCGCQVEEMKQSESTPHITINNSNQNQQNQQNLGIARSKWVTLILWFFFGALGGHKFYQHKYGMGVLYILTLGFCGIGVFIDFFRILFLPTTYYVQ